MPKLLPPHIESDLERIRSHPVILAVQDTTPLNDTGHPPEGAGPINTSQNRAVGLVLHDTMAFTPEGTPLGLLNVQSGARDAAQAALAIDLVVAWRVHWLTRVGREQPNTPCDQILKEEEWRVLSAWATGTMAETVPRLQEATL